MNAEKLNPVQEEAVQHVEGPLLVLAGAGSGKTRIVTHRIAFLLEIGVPASEILAVTFTNKAAEEMRSRVLSLSSHAVLTCTFHSLGNRILRESISALGFSPHFTIYDEEDSRLLVKHCMGQLGLKEEKGLVKPMKLAISGAKNSLIGPADLEDAALEESPPLFKETYLLYEQKLKESNALDFDDLLFLTVRLFQNHPLILESYQKRWSFLLIDEYQDTNMPQYLLAKLLSEKHRNIFAVGDPDQSIYSWRGANIQNILNFEKDYPGAKTISLEQNYRSTNHILKGANAVISHNERRLEKDLWSDLGEGEKIGIYIGENDHDETRFILRRLLKHCQEQGLSLNEAAIFYRMNAQSRIFEDALLKHQIPYVIVGGLSFYQRREIKDVFALLNLILSDRDILSFSRVVNIPKRGIGPTTLSKITKICEERGLSILEGLSRIVSGNAALKLSPKQQKELAQFLALIKGLREGYQTGTSLKELTQKALDDWNYFLYLKEDPETYEDREANIKELVSKIAQWEYENQSNSLSTFLQETSLKTSQEDSPYHTALRLMTLHNSKGLEFDLVFIVGMEEDLFPHINAKDSFEGIEEERRLCYVGMTRAKKQLYLTASKYRFLWGNPKAMVPSRFLGEIPEEEVHFFHEREFPETSPDEGMLAPGTPVFHKDFGKGIVQKAYETSLGLTYDVLFLEQQTTRSLVAKYAKLTLYDNE